MVQTWLINRPFSLPCTVRSYFVLQCMYSKELFCSPVYSKELFCTAVYSKELFCSAVYSKELFCSPVYSKELFCTAVYSKGSFCYAVYSKGLFDLPQVLVRVILTNLKFPRWNATIARALSTLSLWFNSWRKKYKSNSLHEFYIIYLTQPVWLLHSLYSTVKGQNST